MRVLFVTSEMATIFKRGGLADVLYSLPVALAKLGVEASVVMPYYSAIKHIHSSCVGQMAVDWDGKRELVFIFTSEIKDRGVPVYLIRHPLLNNYESDDMPAVFAFFSKCVVRMATYASRAVGGDFDIIHCHDWHTALVPMMLGEDKKISNPKSQVPNLKTIEAKTTKTILTIHNLMYAGETGVGIIRKICLPKSLFHIFKTPLGRAVKLLREGLDYADIISTVSPTYAKEISANTKGLIGSVLHARADRVVGILNGIDNSIWNPKTDRALPAAYDPLTAIEGKQKVKKALRRALHLSDTDVPLFGFVGRIEPRQKGTDIIRLAVRTLPKTAYQLVILGTGNGAEEKRLAALAEKNSHIIYMNTFDERLARRIYAGSDVMLVPSRFEPCGLTQMIAMRYGTIPLVRKTGGLADSVIDGETGFVFDRYSAPALAKKMREVIEYFAHTVHDGSQAEPYKKNGMFWNDMVIRVMREDFSWRTSAKKYLAMYERMIHGER